MRCHSSCNLSNNLMLNMSCNLTRVGHMKYCVPASDLLSIHKVKKDGKMLANMKKFAKVLIKLCGCLSIVTL